MPPPPPSGHAAFRLHLLDAPYYVKQFKTDELIPSHILDALIRTPHSSKFISITRTDEEISVVGESETDSTDPCATWRCIKIAGPMDFGVTGVMCNFTSPLKAAGVPVFAISTWNTDYVLVPKDKVVEAKLALTADGWRFV